MPGLHEHVDGTRLSDGLKARRYAPTPLRGAAALTPSERVPSWSHEPCADVRAIPHLPAAERNNSVLQSIAIVAARCYARWAPRAEETASVAAPEHIHGA